MTTYLPNLREQNLITGPAIWDWEPENPVPDTLRKDKNLRTLWITKTKTRHCVYSFVTGINESIRVSKENPARLLHGIVGDYDSPVSMEVVAEAVHTPKQCPYLPSWYERTLSGNARLLWIFEKPILVAGNEHASGFLAHIGDQLRLKHVLAGLDKAYTDPARYYTNGCVWSFVEGEPLPHALVTGWLVDFSRKFASKKLSPVVIPLDVAATMLAEKYPRFAEWTGDFVEGAQGPSFWVNGSLSPKSALVKPEGMFSFADHAVRGFSSWADLLGRDAVEGYVATRMGEAVSDVYYDGHDYWFPKYGSWSRCNRDDLALKLKCRQKISVIRDPDGTSAMDRAIYHIQMENEVEGVLHMPHSNPGLLIEDGIRHLNVPKVHLVLPVTDPVEWGESGQMPFISRLLDSIFDPVFPQREAFLAWLSYAYQTAHAKTPQPGQVVFLVGATNTGKTLLSREIVGRLFGGFREASTYLMGNDSFGAELFERFIWCVDDGESASNNVGHRKFSEIVKKVAANNTFRYHSKFRMASVVAWNGRVIVTCNNDAVSMRQLPAMDGGSEDKVSLFRCIRKSSDDSSWPGESRLTIEKTIRQELPFFARWLLDYIPEQNEYIVRSVRHGWKSYRDETIVNSANNSSGSVGFEEILAHWTSTYFSQEPVDTWKGTSHLLHRALHMDPLNAPAMRSYSVQQISLAMATLKTRGLYNIDYTENGIGHREWTITRPTNVPRPEKSNGAPPKHRAS